MFWSETSLLPDAGTGAVVPAVTPAAGACESAGTLRPHPVNDPPRIATATIATAILRPPRLIT
jgi:hypothetical protein